MRISRKNTNNFVELITYTKKIMETTCLENSPQKITFTLLSFTICIKLNLISCYFLLRHSIVISTYILFPLYGDILVWFVYFLSFSTLIKNLKKKLLIEIFNAPRKRMYIDIWFTLRACNNCNKVIKKIKVLTYKDFYYLVSFIVKKNCWRKIFQRASNSSKKFVYKLCCQIKRVKHSKD